MRTIDLPDRARRTVQLLAAHDFAGVRRMFHRRVRRVLSARTLAAAWRQHVDVLGASPRVGAAALVDPPPAARVEVPLAVGGRCLTASVHLDGDGRCTDLQVRPSIEEWDAPAYVEPSAFAEEQLVLETPYGEVGATLTIPASTDRVPLAILLMGGGPFDRDGTAGPNRIGRDLAEGLASAGVAVLRFDKPSFRDPALRARADFAPSWDYVPPVRDAVARLSGREGIGPLWLIGHSMGGRYAPRVAAAVPGIAGLVLMAADAAPMHRAAVRVARHLASLPDPVPGASAMVSRVEQAAARVDSPRLSLRTPRSALPFGLTAGTWLELREDDPVATAAALGIPMLLLQGGRDYQVTEDDDLALWRAGLPDADLRVLPADDHSFFPGEGLATPQGYDEPQHVDPAVITAIARFVR